MKSSTITSARWSPIRPFLLSLILRFPDARPRSAGAGQGAAARRVLQPPGARARDQGGAPHPLPAVLGRVGEHLLQLAHLVSNQHSPASAKLAARPRQHAHRPGARRICSVAVAAADRAAAPQVRDFSLSSREDGVVEFLAEPELEGRFTKAPPRPSAPPARLAKKGEKMIIEGKTLERASSSGG